MSLKFNHFCDSILRSYKECPHIAKRFKSYFFSELPLTESPIAFPAIAPTIAPPTATAAAGIPIAVSAAAIPIPPMALPAIHRRFLRRLHLLLNRNFCLHFHSLKFSPLYKIFKQFDSIIPPLKINCVLHLLKSSKIMVYNA